MPNDCQPGMAAVFVLAGIFCPYSGMRKFFSRGKMRAIPFSAKAPSLLGLQAIDV